MCTFVLITPRHEEVAAGGKCIAQYYLKQAQLAARLALAESDTSKARALHVLAMDYYDKPDKAKVEEARAKCG